MAAGFAPMILWRRGAVPFHELAPLGNEETMRILAAVRDGRRWRGELSAVLENALHAAVPRAPSGDRRLLLRLRRHLFNDRIVRAGDLELARSYLDDARQRDLHAWVTCREHEDTLLATAREVLDEEAVAARRHLARLAGAPEFARGTQLCGETLRRRVAEFARAGGEVPKRLRPVVGSITSLAYRSSLKPSPFGAFTTTGFWPMGVARIGERAEVTHRRSVVMANRALLDWMVSTLTAADGLHRIRLNRTLSVRGDELEFYVAGSAGHLTEAERFRVISMTEPVARIVLLLSDGPRVRGELLVTLRSHLGEERAEQELDALVSLGVCENVCWVPDEEPEYAAAVAARLPEGPAAQAFCSLAEAERAFGQASVAERDELLSRVDRSVSRLRTELAVCEPPSEAVRSTLYEDVRSDSGPRWWRPDLVADNQAGFTLLQRLLPLFDDTAIARHGLYRFFVRQYGGDGRCVDVLELYRRFVQLGQDETTELLSGVGDAEAARCYRLRGRFAAGLDGWIADARGTARVELDRDWLEEFVGSFPACLRPWRSATYLMQFHGTLEERPGIVVNEVRSGSGTFYARFLDRDARMSVAIQRDVISTGDHRQTDLAAVLGCNYNVHPRLSPFVVEYPGTSSAYDDVLTLRDLAVRANPAHQTLELVSQRDDAPLTLMPLNAAQPVSMPELYQFLHLFVPSATYRTGWLWWLYIAMRPKCRQLPRLVVGNLTVERRTWRVPIQSVGEVLGDARDDVDLLLAAARWRHDNQLPRRCFFRLQDGRAGPPDWQNRTARDYKPHYLDFENVLLLRILCRSIGLAGQDGVLVIQECLPDPETYASARSSTCSAEEFAVELNLGGEA